MQTLTKNKKGQIINLLTTTVVSVVVFIFIVFALFFGIGALNPSGFFPRTTNNNSYDSVIALQDNTTKLVQNFSQQLPTAGTIFGIVLLMGVLGILIVIILRFKGSAGGGGGGNL